MGVWHQDPPALGEWDDGKKYEVRRYDDCIVYEQAVQVGARMTEWGVPLQAQIIDLARIDSTQSADHQLQSMWECGRTVGHREGYTAAMAAVRKLIGLAA